MEIEKQSQDFLGKGWSFPPTFHRVSGTVAMLQGVEDIYSSLHILMTTMTGERVMQPHFGCNLEVMLFEPMNTATKTFITDKIETAILYFEPRIRPDRVALDDSLENEGVLAIQVDFTIKATNSRYNFVFPFYRKESSELIQFLTSGFALANNV